MKILTTFYIDPELKKRVVEYCEKNHIKQAKFFNDAIRVALGEK